jgi:hypothetical protein
MLSSGRAPAVGKDYDWSKTVMLLEGEGTNGSVTIRDSSSTARTMSVGGNAQVSTAQFKYGSASILFDGSGDYVFQTGTASTYALGTGDFTIEAWVYANNFTSGKILYDSRPTGTTGVYPTLFVSSTGVVQFYVSETLRIDGSAISTSTWTHIAVSRSGTSTKLFINGTQSGSTYTDTNNYLNGTSRPTIGASGYNLANSWNGNVDGIRVTKGLARYTANFTAPTAAHPNRG